MANEVQISGDILRGIGWLESEAPRYFKRALTRGAIVLKDRTRQNLQSVLPASSNHNPKYNDTLQDAIRNSKVSIDHVTVHILGTRNSGSGTFRTRFFEGGTKSGTRYQKTRNGEKRWQKSFLPVPSDDGDGFCCPYLCGIMSGWKIYGGAWCYTA